VPQELEATSSQVRYSSLSVHSTNRPISNEFDRDRRYSTASSTVSPILNNGKARIQLETHKLPDREANLMAVYDKQAVLQKEAKKKEAVSLVKKVVNDEFGPPSISDLDGACKIVSRSKELFWPVIDEIENGLKHKHWCIVLKSLILLHWCAFSGEPEFATWARKQISKKGLICKSFRTLGDQFLDANIEAPKHCVCRIADELAASVFDDGMQVDPSTYEPLSVPTYMLAAETWEVTLKGMTKSEKSKFMNCS
jgi:hypothetical protein